MNKNEKISDDLKLALEILQVEILILHNRFDVYKDLFGSKKEFVDLLNKTSGNFFYLLQTGILENIIMSISRLSDGAELNKNKNLSLKGLIRLIENDNLKKELNLQFEWYLEKTTDVLKAWRSKKVAHIDYDVALSKTELQNENSIQNINFAITSIRQFYNTVHKHYYGSKMAFGFPGNSASRGLLISLEQADIFRKYIHKLKVANEEIPNELKIDYEKFKLKDNEFRF